MKSIKSIVLGVVLLMTTVGFGQNKLTKDEKIIGKCWKVYNTKSSDKGIEKLNKYMNKTQGSSLYAYESLVQMEYANYLEKKDIFSDITITTTTTTSETGTETTEGNSDEEGASEKIDSLMNNLQEIMNSYYKEHIINVCRRSTIESNSPTADVYLRKFIVDFDPDTVVSEKAKAYYDEAEESFGKKDFELAILNYRKAIEEDSTYYKAVLYLGDSFWMQESYDSALFYYSRAAQIQPKLLEARIYVIDALVEQGLYYRAKKECIEALLVYPGYNLKFKFQRILSVENKLFNERRVIRFFYPNDMNIDEQGSLHDPYWSDYRAAKKEVSKYCDEDGIIEENGEFEGGYLEVYSIRKMLDNHPNDLPEYLHFADKMKEEGYLEPYVFISLFHIDIYKQFEHYMSFEENREKAREFLDKYVIDPLPSN